jgi:hypothetical protein
MNGMIDEERMIFELVSFVGRIESFLTVTHYSFGYQAIRSLLSTCLSAVESLNIRTKSPLHLSHAPIFALCPALFSGLVTARCCDRASNCDGGSPK